MNKLVVGVVLAALAVSGSGCGPGKKAPGDVAGGTRVRTAKRVPKAGHIVADSVRALEISRAGDRVAGIFDGEVRLYTSGGKELKRFAPPQRTRFERFFAAPDFSWFVAMTLSQTGTVLRFLDADLNEKKQIEFTEDTLVTLSEVTARADRINSWTAESPGLAADFRKLRTLQASEDPKDREEARSMLAKLKRKFTTRRAAYDRNGLEVWSMPIGDLTIDLMPTSGSQNQIPGPLYTSPDGAYFFSEGTPETRSDPENTVYDAASGQPRFQIPLREKERIIPRWASPEIGLYIFSVFGGEDPSTTTFKVSRWEVSGKRLWEKDIPNVLEYANSGLNGTRILMMTSPAGQESDKSVLLWDASGNEAGAKTLDLRAELGKDYKIRETVSADLSEDGKHFMYCAIYIVPSVLGENAQPHGSVRDQGFFQCRVYDTDTGGIIFKTQSANLQDGSRYRGLFGRSGFALAEIRDPPDPPPPKEGAPAVPPRKLTVTVYSY